MRITYRVQATWAAPHPNAPKGRRAPLVDYAASIEQHGSRDAAHTRAPKLHAAILAQHRTATDLKVDVWSETEWHEGAPARLKPLGTYTDAGWQYPATDTDLEAVRGLFADIRATHLHRQPHLEDR